MYQAGVKNIMLYENNGIKFRNFDLYDESQITDLSNLGQVITIDNSERPTFEIDTKFSKIGKRASDYKLNFVLPGLTESNLDLISKLSESVYGWCFLVEFYDGTFKFFNVPVFYSSDKIKPHEEMAFEVSLSTNTPTLKRFLNYTANVSGVPEYSFDSTLLTIDSTIYSFDYV